MAWSMTGFRARLGEEAVCLGVSVMRVGLVGLSVLLLSAMTSAVFAACPVGADCDQPVVVRATAPVYFDAPPAGYALDPSDARPDLYLVNQGPVYDGPNVLIFAQPTYSESGFAYASPYPYVHFYTYGRGRHAYRAWSAHHRYGAKALNYPPYATFRYQPASSARVIEVR
jgi:hypothetical protein